jgi:hydroxyacid-oxoacid transhydrogenase
MWAIRALELMAEFLPRAVADTSDEDARGQMMLAAAIAGIGFGNAGVHLPHGMSYPVAGMVRDFQPPGYHVDHPMVPHGISVILNTAAVVRFTADTNPARHLEAARALGADISDADPLDGNHAGRLLEERVVHFMKTLGMPNGLAAVGYSDDDIPNLVEGTLPQHRVTKLSPREASREDLVNLFQDSMQNW